MGDEGSGEALCGAAFGLWEQASGSRIIAELYAWALDGGAGVPTSNAVGSRGSGLHSPRI